MRERIDIFFGDSLIRLSFFLSAPLFIISCIVIIVSYSNLPSLIPFFNSFLWGKERLTPSFFVLFLPAFFFVVFLFNFLFSIFFYQRFTIISRILSINVLFVIFFGFMAYLEILLLVF